MSADRWNKSRKRLERIRRSIYMRGWDDALIGNRNNPYHRSDHQATWENGYKSCMAGNPLPYWYREWREVAR